MNVSSLELSKRLYELSGWGATLHPEETIDGEVFPQWVEVETLPAWQGGELVGDTFFDGTTVEDTYPAYDLGYLIRKLPHTSITRLDGSKKHLYVADSFDMLNESRQSVQFRADTPEDAACKLAIALFEQGILRKETE